MLERPHAVPAPWQERFHFQRSERTPRLIGLLWTLLEGDSLLLLEEPELSLHSKIVSKLPSLIWRLQRAKHRQVLVSSHSAELFSDRGIKPTEVALLRPRGSEGTVVELASDKDNCHSLSESTDSHLFGGRG